MSERNIKARILRELGALPDVRLFVNPVGQGWQGHGVPKDGGVFIFNPRRVTFGLFPGSGDLIGWRSVVITPDMVGRRLAVFASIEVKSDHGVASDEQENWLNATLKAGAFAGITNSADGAREVLGLQL